jgi:hypothetical protein
MSSYTRHSNPLGTNDNDFIVSVTDISKTFNRTAVFSKDIASDDEVEVTTKTAQRNFSSILSDDHLVSVQPASKIWENNSKAQSIFEENLERRKNKNDDHSANSDDVIAVVVRNKSQQAISPTTQSAALGLQFQIDPFTELSATEIKDVPIRITTANEIKYANMNQVPSSLAMTSSFFDEMEQTMDGVSGANQISHQAAVDDFELKLKNMLSGRVPEEYANKVENETNPTTHTVQNSSQSIKSISPEKDSGNPHAFFDQITQARSQARVMDLGTFKANLDFLDSVDQSRELQRQEEESMNAEKIRSMSFTSQKTGAKPVEIPDAVTMTSMDWVEDLAQVTVEPKAEALAVTTEAPTNTPVNTDAIHNNPSEQPLLNDQRNSTTICVCADLPKAQ